MAKALLGYVGGTDPRLLEEARRLRLRVRDLEAQLVRLQDENESLVAALHDENLHDENLHDENLHESPLLGLDHGAEREPALT